jgi:hypothetical protein
MLDKKMELQFLSIDLITNKPRTDLLFPEIALNHLSTIPIVFLLGLSPLLLQQQPIQH